MSDSTPSKGAVFLAPTSQVKTTQATFIAVIVGSFVCGGLMMSIKNDVSNIRKDVDRVMSVVFYNQDGRESVANPKTAPRANP